MNELIPIHNKVITTSVEAEERSMDERQPSKKLEKK
jgi:hypothetical protein